MDFWFRFKAPCPSNPWTCQFFWLWNVATPSFPAGISQAWLIFFSLMPAQEKEAKPIAGRKSEPYESAKDWSISSHIHVCFCFRLAPLFEHQKACRSGYGQVVMAHMFCNSQRLLRLRVPLMKDCYNTIMEWSDCHTPPMALRHTMWWGKNNVSSRPSKVVGAIFDTPSRPSRSDKFELRFSWTWIVVTSLWWLCCHCSTIVEHIDIHLHKCRLSLALIASIATSRRRWCCSKHWRSSTWPIIISRIW